MSISSKVAGVKEWSIGGGKDGIERGEGVEEGLVCRLKCSFEISSQKWQIVEVEQPEGMMWAGND